MTPLTRWTKLMTVVVVDVVDVVALVVEVELVEVVVSGSQEVESLGPEHVDSCVVVMEAFGLAWLLAFGSFGNLGICHSWTLVASSSFSSSVMSVTASSINLARVLDPAITPANAFFAPLSKSSLNSDSPASADRIR